MSEGGVGLAAVLRLHRPTRGMAVSMGTTCSCGFWSEGGRRVAGDDGLDDHRAAAALDHLAAKASEAAVVELVAEAVYASGEDDWYLTTDGSANSASWDYAKTALTAFLGALGGSVGPAGVEVAPGATDEVLGRQEGGNDCGSRMSRDREAEPCSKAEGHIGQHANSYCVWSDK